MPRPPSTHGGRPHTIRVRLSGAELAAVDTARGDLTVSTYVRQVLLHGPITPPPRDQPPAVVHPIPEKPHPDHVCNWVPAGNLFLRCTICDQRRPR